MSDFHSLIFDRLSMTYVASPVMLLVFDSFHLVPQIPFVRNPFNVRLA